MVAITSQQPATVPVSSNAIPAAELRAVPEQERPLNNPDNAVAAPKNTQSSDNQPPQSQDRPPETAEAGSAEIVPPPEQQLQRVAVEGGATPPTATPPPAPEAEVETEAPVAQAQPNPQPAPPEETDTLSSEPSTANFGSAAALSTYQSVGNLGSESNRPETAEPAQPTVQSSAPTASDNTSTETDQASTERQVFGGAIDAPRPQQAG